MGIGNVFKIDDRYINIDRLSIIGDNGDHSPNFFRQTSLLFHEWLAERFNLEDAWIVNVGYKDTSIKSICCVPVYCTLWF